MSIYKITATILKPGGAPVIWERWQPEIMTRRDCEATFSRTLTPGRFFELRVKVIDFQCERIDSTTMKMAEAGGVECSA